MSLNEALSALSTVPINTSYPDLPKSYSNLKYGLDCFGFVVELSRIYAKLELLTGIYNKKITHAAARIDDYFIDPFLKMTEPMRISSSPTTVDTYYLGSSLVGQLVGGSKYLFQVDLVRSGVSICTYSYNLNARPSSDRQPHSYKYTFLNQGRPISIEKQSTTGNTCNVKNMGADKPTTDSLLNLHFGLSSEDIAKMFFDAGQNASYKQQQSSWFRF